MDELSIVFVREKETKGTVRFTEVASPGKRPIIGTIYVRKEALGDKVDTVSQVFVSLEFAE